MKKSKQELMRVETMINSDRLRLKDDFIKLMESDLKRLLSEYFHLENAPLTEIIKDGKIFRVNINFSCSEIKNFINVP
jgi:hypothetical protein